MRFRICNGRPFETRKPRIVGNAGCAFVSASIPSPPCQHRGCRIWSKPAAPAIPEPRYQPRSTRPVRQDRARLDGGTAGTRRSTGHERQRRCRASSADPVLTSTPPSSTDARRLVMLHRWRWCVRWLGTDLPEDRLQGLNSRRERIVVIVDCLAQYPCKRFGFFFC